MNFDINVYILNKHSNQDVDKISEYL